MERWEKIKTLIEVTDGSRIIRDADGLFRKAITGIYRME